MAMENNLLKLKRIGAIGDIHAESRFLEISLQYLAASNTTPILSVGDIVDGRGNVDRCCELLKKYGVYAVRGNHDRWFLENKLRQLKDATQRTDINPYSYDYLTNLPTTEQFETPLGALLLCHGIAEHDMIRLTPDDYGYAISSNLELQELIHSKQFRFVINGHTHLRMVRKFESKHDYQRGKSQI